MSTFQGLEMAKQALFAQQSALYTTSHNISNANTDGYTRQRVNFETAPPFPPASRNAAEIAGQRGTGVETGSIERVRNQFLDQQYRTENSSSGYWSAKSDALERVENVMNEPSDTGLSAAMDDFWQSLEDLSTNPEDAGARSVVAQRGQAVAETFNYLSDSLNTIKDDLYTKGDSDTQIDYKVDKVNSITSQIDTLNDRIKNIEASGQLPNDLYDKRDKLIDDLSEIVDVEVTYDESSDGASAMAEGLASVKMNMEGSKPVLVKGDTDDDQGYNEISVTKASDDKIKISLDGTKYGKDELPTGSLKGMIESADYIEDDMLGDLNDLASTFANAFNEVHKSGVDLNEDQETGEFFQGGSAGELSVNDSIVKNPSEIAASKDFNADNNKDPSGNAGNGDNAQKLADIFDTVVGDLDDLADDNSDIADASKIDGNTSINGFYQSMISTLGVDAQEANNKTDNTETLRTQVETQRQSVSSVSLDEEMTNMIQFQHAYNAAARSMTAVDEMLDRVINNMGLVGR